MIYSKNNQISHQKAGIYLTCLLSIFLVIACSDGGGDVTGTDPDLNVECADLELEENVSDPVSRMLVHGIEQNLGDEPFVWIYDAEDENEENRLPAYLERIEGTTGELIVPVHPTDWEVGGVTEVVIRSQDESITCPAQSLTIEGLEPTTETLEEAVDDITLNLSQLAEAKGYDAAELAAANIGQLDAHIAGLASVIQAFQGEHHPNNIQALLSGEAPVLQELEEDNQDEQTIEIFHAIMAQSGMFDLFEQVIDELSQRSKVVESQKISAANWYAVNRLTPGKVVEATDQPQAVTPGELDILMAEQLWFAEMNASNVEEFREKLEITFGSVSAAVALVGGATLAGYMGALGNSVSFIGLYWKYSEGVLPSQLQDIELIAETITYKEDQDDVGSWSAEMSAQSVGWTLTWPDVLGVVPVVGPAGKVLSKMSGMLPGLDNLTVTMLDTFQHYFTAIWGMTEDSGPYSIPSLIYEIEDGISPDRDNEEEYFTWELRRIQGELDDDPFIFGDIDTEYHPHSVGKTQLRVRTEVDRFQDEFRESIIELEVTAIEVEFETEPPFYIDPGEEDPIHLTVNVSNAEEYENSWELDGDGQLFMIDDYEAEYYPPDEETIDLIIVNVESEGGARDHPNAPERGATARINVEEQDLIVSPIPECLSVETKHQFNATLEGEAVSFSDLDWQITGPGSLGTDGVFIAVEEGEVSIEFWLRENENITYQISFEVEGACKELVVSPAPVCLEPDQSHTFNAEIDGKNVSFNELDWQITGPGSLGNDGVFVPGGEGDVMIDFWYIENSNKTYQVNFEVRDFCSYIQITSSEFEFNSTCLSLEPLDPSDPTFDFRDGSGSMYDFFVEMFREDTTPIDEIWAISVSQNDSFMKFILLYEDLIEDQGTSEWEIEIESFDWRGAHLSPDFQWGAYFFDDSWQVSAEGWGTGAGHPMSIQRTMRVVDGEEIPVYSGSYVDYHVLPEWVIGNHNEYHNEYVLSTVKFEGVIPGERGCF